MKRNIPDLGRRIIIFIRRAIISLVLLTLIMGIIGFTVKWGEWVLHPALFLMDFRSITEDIFALLLVYEILDLFRTLSPNRLMDVVLTVLARKILLSANDAHLLMEVAAFVAILIVRLLWTYFIEKPLPTTNSAATTVTPNSARNEKPPE